MREPYMVTSTHEEIYSSHFLLHSDEFDNQIYFYAECSKNSKYRGDDDYYYLELFFSVEEYGAREYLIGLYFGNDKMDKQSLDKEIQAYLVDQLDDTFPALVKQYLKKEQLLEIWLDNQEHN